MSYNYFNKYTSKSQIAGFHKNVLSFFKQMSIIKRWTIYKITIFFIYTKLQKSIAPRKVRFDDHYEEVHKNSELKGLEAVIPLREKFHINIFFFILMRISSRHTQSIN